MEKIIGSQIFNLIEVDSTNNFAAKLVSDHLCQNGAVIMADYQTDGKGQRGNKWDSNKGENLIMSIVFQPDNLSVSEQIKISWATCISIIDLLTFYGIEAKIKWPNDIYIRIKKIAGILIENQISGNLVNNSIIGIGMNVNQLHFQFRNATSLLLECKNVHSIKEVSELLIEKLNSNLFQEFNFLKNRFEANLFHINKMSQFEDESGIFEGTIIGISENGQLKVKKGEEIKYYGIKELIFRIDP